MFFLVFTCIYTGFVGLTRVEVHQKRIYSENWIERERRKEKNRKVRKEIKQKLDKMRSSQTICFRTINFGVQCCGKSVSRFQEKKII